MLARLAKLFLISQYPDDLDHALYYMRSSSRISDRIPVHQPNCQILHHPFPQKCVPNLVTSILELAVANNHQSPPIRTPRHPSSLHPPPQPPPRSHLPFLAMFLLQSRYLGLCRSMPNACRCSIVKGWMAVQPNELNLRPYYGVLCGLHTMRDRWCSGCIFGAGQGRSEGRRLNVEQAEGCVLKEEELEL